MDGLKPAAPASHGAEVRHLARGGAFSLAGSVVGGLAAFVTTAVVTRGTTTDTAGVFFIGISVLLLLFPVVRLGAPTGLVYFMARFAALGQSDRLRSVVRTACGPVTTVTLVTALILGAAASPIAARLIPSAPHAAVSSLRVVAVFLPLAVAADLAVYAARGLHALRPLVLIDRLGRPVLQLLAVVVFLALAATSAAQVTFAYVLPYLPAAAVAVWWFSRILARHEHQVHARPAPGTMRREFWAYTWPRWLQNIAAIVLQRLDIILLGAMAGVRDAAIYAAVTRFLVFGQLTATAIGAVVEPTISRLVALGDHLALSTVYRMSTAWLIVVTWPIYLGMLVLAPDLPLLFGRDYASGTPVIVALALTMLVATACGLVDSMLSMAGRTVWTFWNAVGALVVNVTLNLLLIPRIGYVGSAVAWSAAILFKNLVPLVQIQLSMRLHPFGRASLVASVLSVVTLGVVPGGLTIAGASVLLVLVSFALGLLAYAALLWRYRVVLGLESLVPRNMRGAVRA